MRTIWTLFKISIALAITIPVALFALALTVGVVGTFVGLAIAALRLACIALVAYGVYRMARLLFRTDIHIGDAGPLGAANGRSVLCHGNERA